MLAYVPMAFILTGIAAYAVLAGADFGAGIWMLIPGGDRASIRDHTRHAMGPVWEANHVWLIFVLVVAWTCYPVAYGSIVSTLSIPLFIAAVGIILRGAAYALRGQLDRARGARAVENLFALSCVLTPFALGTVIGGIATGRVPVGNAQGNLITAWLNPVSILAGVLAVAFCAYLAAVYLAADAHRLREPELARDFRMRALASGAAAGALALAGLLVLRADARSLWGGLTSGTGLAMVIVCALAGVATLALVWRGRFGPARVPAALAVTAVIAGWAAAQEPRVLPGLSISQAAAGRTTLIATIVAVAAGAAVLVPSLALLYTLLLRGRLDRGQPRAADTAHGGAAPPRPRDRRLAAVVIGATLVAGVGLLVFAGPTWALGLGALCLVGCAVTTFAITAVPGA